MNKRVNKSLKDIFYRYSILIFLSIFGVFIFQSLFQIITVYPSFFLFKLFYKVVLANGNLLIFSGKSISLEIIGPCVAGSAYLLLTILNISVPNIKIKKRLKLLLLAYLSFLLINLLRIFLIGIFFVEKISWADTAHKFFWYFGSIFAVIIIWFLQVGRNKIKEIPFYSDLKFFYKLTKK